jgi:hypothetical protein
VLEGIPARDVPGIVSAIQNELGHLFNQGNIPVGIQNRNIAQIDGGAIQIRPGATPESTGQQIAQNLYRGLVNG